MSSEPRHRITLSIIIPSFGQAQELRGALESIQVQSFRDFEVLIMDAGSDDSVKKVVDEFTQLPIRFNSEPDNGIYDAMNKGVAKSLGNYLYFMGCDDRFASPEILSRVFNRTAYYADVIYGDVIMESDGRVYDGKFTSLKLMDVNICHQAIFTKRTVFDQVGGFDLRYKVWADWEFNIRWFTVPGITRQYVPLVIALYNNKGFSSRKPDYVFLGERASIESKYFPFILRVLKRIMRKRKSIKIF